MACHHNPKIRRRGADLIEAFEDAYAVAGEPPHADIFMRRRGDGSFVFYLSPTASALFGEFVIACHGVSCDEPSPDERKVRVRL